MPTDTRPDPPADPLRQRVQASGRLSGQKVIASLVRHIRIVFASLVASSVVVASVPGSVIHAESIGVVGVADNAKLADLNGVVDLVRIEREFVGSCEGLVLHKRSVHVANALRVVDTVSSVGLTSRERPDHDLQQNLANRGWRGAVVADFDADTASPDCVSLAGIHVHLVKPNAWVTMRHVDVSPFNGLRRVQLGLINEPLSDGYSQQAERNRSQQPIDDERALIKRRGPLALLLFVSGLLLCLRPRHSDYEGRFLGPDYLGLGLIGAGLFSWALL